VLEGLTLRGDVLRQFGIHPRPDLQRRLLVHSDPRHARDGIAAQRRQSLNDVEGPLIGRAALATTSTLTRFRSTTILAIELAALFYYLSNQSPEGEVGRAGLDRLVNLTGARAGSYGACHHKSLLVENGNVARSGRLRKDIGW
jgi:hypothetical protein